MSEPLKFQNPLTRIVAIKSRPLVHGLADPQVPNQQSTNAAGESSLNRFYPRDGSAWQNEPVLGPNAAQFKTVLPGMFTGEMRKVVQDNISRGLTVPYSFNFNNTNGIFVAGNGDRYVLEITSGSISAWPLKKRDTPAGDNRLDSLDYVPGLSPRPTGENANTIITMTVPGLFVPYQGRAALFPEAGWAFSASGHLASAVTIESRADAPNNPGPTYLYTRRYTITISEADNKPSAGNIVSDMEGWFHGNKVDYHIKYPNYEFSTLASLDWNMGVNTHPTTTDVLSPVHCWYEGEVLKEVNRRVAYGTTTVINKTHNSTAACTYDEGEELGTFTRVTGNKNGFDTPLFTAQDHTSLTGNKYVWGKVAPLVQFAQEANDEVFFNIFVEGKTYRIGINDAVAIDDYITIPFNDREAVIHYVETETFTGETGTGIDGVNRIDRVGDYYDRVSSTVCPVPPLGFGERLYFDPNSLQNAGPCTRTWGIGNSGGTLYEGGNEQTKLCSGITRHFFRRDYVNSSNTNAWDSYTATGVTSSTVDEVKAYIGGTEYTLSNDAAEVAKWGDFLVDLTDTMIAIVAVDASGTIGPIYTDKPSITAPFGDSLLGPVGYPVAEIAKKFPSWIGNPKKEV